MASGSGVVRLAAAVFLGLSLLLASARPCEVRTLAEARCVPIGDGPQQAREDGAWGEAETKGETPGEARLISFEGGESQYKSVRMSLFFLPPSAAHVSSSSPLTLQAERDLDHISLLPAGRVLTYALSIESESQQRSMALTIDAEVSGLRQCQTDCSWPRTRCHHCGSPLLRPGPRFMTYSACV